MPANQSTPEVTSHAADILDQYASFIRNDVKADDFERHPYVPEIEETAQALRDLATPARGGDELREAASNALMYLQTGFMECPQCGHEITTADLDATYALADVVEPAPAALASTDMAGASVPDRLARRMGAEFIARDDVPQVEGLTSGEGLRALSDRATAGPWAWEQCGDKEDAPVVGIAFPGDDPDCKAPYEGEFRDSDASRMTIAYDWQWCDGNSPSANAAFAVACVNYVRAMLAASPKAAATASVREDCAAACDRIATGSVYIGESEEGRARHEGIIAGARNCAAAIRRLTDSGTAATIGGERA